MLSTLRMANISSTDAEQFSCSQVELCEALLDMSSERVDEAVITEPADVELEQVSLIKYEQKFIWILIMQLAIRLILWMRLLYQSKSMVRIINWLEITDGFRSRKKYNDIQHRLLGISL
jgi:hypothetical protein